MKTFGMGWVVSLTLAGLTLGSSGQDVGADAVAAAEEWLILVDQGDYEKSWESASAFFKGAVAVDQWEASLQAFRAPLGGVVSRAVKSADYRTSLPGAPDGQYVVIQFETSFENKQSALETVTPMKDDGVWRVGGYFIR